MQQNSSQTPFPPEALARSLRGEGAAALVARLDGPPGLAAFDADGTLWDGDLGEVVLQKLIAAGRLLDAPADPWGEYLRRVEIDPADGFAYAGRLMAGLSEDLLREVSVEVFGSEFVPRVFPESRFLLKTLLSRGWEIYVVSGSNRWSIEVAADALGLSRARVVALDLETRAGILTDRVKLPVPTLEGKPALLRTRIAGRGLDLAFGNSVFDLPMLLSAAMPVAVGVTPAPVHRPNELLAHAVQRGWARLEIPAI